MPDVERPRIMTLRRAALLACAAAALVVAAVNSRAIMPEHGRKETAAASNVAARSATARAAPNLAGFADIVDTVKPAVIGVRVALPAHLSGDDDGELSFDDFRRKFGSPQDAPDDSQSAPKGRRGQSERAVLVSQGSGFFISADGYAVTNHRLVGNSK